MYLEDIPGALYSSGPLAISGHGSLTLNVRGPEHGIYSPTNIWIRGGDIAVSGPPKDALHVGGTFRMDNGLLRLEAQSNGIDADRFYLNGGSIRIISVSSNVSGIKCDGDMVVGGGNLNAVVKGDRSKGVACGGDLTIHRGSLSFLLSGNVYLKQATNGATIYKNPKYCTGISCDSNLTMNAGSIVMTHAGIAGKAISIDGNMTMWDGTVDLVVSGNSSGTFTNEDGDLDVAGADCLKVDGDLAIAGGTLKMLASGTAGDGITAGGTLVFGTSGSTNGPTVNVATRGQRVYLYGSSFDGEYSNPKAIKGGGNVTVHGGHIMATTSNNGGEGLESKANLVVNGGTIEITAYDDCINASRSITVNGGCIYCYSSGNDGLDANGTFLFTGGLIVSSGTSTPEEGFDCDQNTFAVNGGILIGTGGNTSYPTAASSSQRYIILSGTVAGGTILQLTDASGDVVVYRIPRTYASGIVILLSTPEIAGGTSYSVLLGGTVSGGTEFHGYYTGGTVTGGTTVVTFTTAE